MTTQTASLVTMDEATDKASVAAFVEDVLAGTGWELEAVRRRSSKLDPPHWYWAPFDILINKEGDERRLRLVAQGALNPATRGGVSPTLPLPPPRPPLPPLQYLVLSPTF